MMMLTPIMVATSLLSAGTSFVLNVVVMTKLPSSSAVYTLVSAMNVISGLSNFMTSKSSEVFFARCVTMAAVLSSICLGGSTLVVGINAELSWASGFAASALLVLTLVNRNTDRTNEMRIDRYAVIERFIDCCSCALMLRLASVKTCSINRNCAAKNFSNLKKDQRFVLISVVDLVREEN
ncbi:MAG: hypothetical protein WCT03_07235 [Candidatus Obscuribacterales bacterium]|jgi:hypothetical protein